MPVGLRQSLTFTASIGINWYLERAVQIIFFVFKPIAKIISRINGLVPSVSWT